MSHHREIDVSALFPHLPPMAQPADATLVLRPGMVRCDLCGTVYKGDNDPRIVKRLCSQECFDAWSACPFLISPEWVELMAEVPDSPVSSAWSPEVAMAQRLATTYEMAKWRGNIR